MPPEATIVACRGAENQREHMLARRAKRQSIAAFLYFVSGRV